MKRNFLTILATSALLTACGGGSGGGDNGGFQPKAPKIILTVAKDKITPNPNSARLENLPNNAISMIDIAVNQGSRPLETGEEEAYVQVLSSSTAAGRIYCFAAENDGCWEDVDDGSGNTLKVAVPLGGTPINLNGGNARFAVTASNNQIGYIDLKVTATGVNNTNSTKYLRINVGYQSSGAPYQIRILGPNLINPEVPNQIAISITDEAGNPVSNPDNDNIIVTATNIKGTTLGFNGSIGASINASTENGIAPISVLAPSEGFLTITAQADSSDNNITNGIQSIISLSKVIQVAKNQNTSSGPIRITTSNLPNGVIGIPYEFSIPTSGSPASYFIVDSGNVPPGLELSEQGILKGIPLLSGDYTFTVSATGANGSVSTRELSIKIIEGSLKFNPEQFADIKVSGEKCTNVAQVLRVEAEGSYKLSKPFEWFMDSSDVKTALGVNKAVDLKNANGELLPELQLTVTGDTTQVTMNGKVCPENVNSNGHAIILAIKDRNNVTFESVVPLIIDYDNNPDTGSGTDPKKCDDFSPTPPGCNEVTVSNGKVGEVYEITVQGATASSKVIEGSLPPGLELDGGTKIKGTPTKSGTYTVLIGNGTTSQVVYITITD